MTNSQLRSDAMRNRRAILDAARQLFAESAEVSMCEVARHAGVGQATLYRNFEDRRALAAEILVEQLERLTQLADDYAGDPDAFFVLLRSLIESMGDLYALGELARRDACVGSELEQHRHRIAELMKRPLSDAKAAGALTPRRVPRRRLPGAAHGEGRHDEGRRSASSGHRGQPRPDPGARRHGATRRSDLIRAGADQVGLEKCPDPPP